MGILDTIAKEVAEETPVNSGNSTGETTTEPVAETPNPEAETPASENANPATEDNTENNTAEPNNSAPEVQRQNRKLHRIYLRTMRLQESTIL